MSSPRTPPRRSSSVPVNTVNNPFGPPSNPFTQLLQPPNPTRSNIHSPNNPYDHEFDSPQTILTPGSIISQVTERAGIQSAYVAERSSADLINVLDLPLLTPPKSTNMTDNKASNTISDVKSGIRGKTISPPLTPERLTAIRPSTSSSSPGSGMDTSPVSKTTINHQTLTQARTGVATRGPPRPPRPPVSPLDLEITNDPEVLQPHPLSAFQSSHLPNPSTSLPREADKRFPSSPPHPSPTQRNMNDSFMQWSDTASSVPSESMPSSTYASSLSIPADVDRSFFRMTRTTIFSDFSAPSTVPDVPDPSCLPIPFKRPTGSSGQTLLSAIPETKAIVAQEVLVSSPTGEEPGLSSSVEEGKARIDTECRSSAGTFGPRHARHSVIGSTSTKSGNGERYRVNPFASPPRSIAAQSHSPPTCHRKQRPLSLSSASDTTYTESAYSGRALDDTALAARRALGVFPPTHPQQSGKALHKHPESEQAIEEYLQNQRERNERRIMPSDKAPPKVGHEGLGAPIGLDDRQGFLRDSTDGLERRASPSPGLPPPLRSHKASASVPMSSAPASSQNHLLPQHNKHYRSQTLAEQIEPPRQQVSPLFRTDRHLANTHLRSASIDSLPSLHPSLSESVNTLSQLLPHSPTKVSVPISPSQTHSRASTNQNRSHVPSEDLRARNDLTPEQRAILLRRTRKIEQMLGESLPEGQIERMVVDPHNLPAFLVSSEDGWLIPSRHFTRDRRELETGGSPTSQGGNQIPKGSDRDVSPSTTRLTGDRPRGLDRNREYMPKSAAAHRTPSPPPVQSPTRRDRSSGSIPVTPSSISGPSGRPAKDDDEETSSRGRRQQLAKLHRLLGAPIPPKLLNPYNPPLASPGGTTPIAAPSPQQATNSTLVPHVVAARAPGLSGQSYITFDDGPLASVANNHSGKWKFVSSFRKRGSSSALSQVQAQSQSQTQPESQYQNQLPDDASFIDMGSSRSNTTLNFPGFGLGQGGGMSREEKNAMRKRSAKLEQVLGDRPPLEMYMPPAAPHRAAQFNKDPLDSSASPSHTLRPPNLRLDLITNTHNKARLNPDSPVSSRVLPPGLITGSDNRNSVGSFDAYAASLQGLLYLVENDQDTLAEMIDTLNVDSESSPDPESRSVTPDVQRGGQDESGHDRGHAHSRSLSSSRLRTPPSPMLDSPRSSSIYDTFLDFTSGPQEQGRNSKTRLKINRKSSDTASFVSSSSDSDQRSDSGGDGEADKEVDPQSRSARRRRTGKLSAFFGENVNLSLPIEAQVTSSSAHHARSRSPYTNTKAQGYRHNGEQGAAYGNTSKGTSSKWKERRETLDGILSEMWRNVQADVGRGSIAGDEAVRLGALLGLVREKERGTDRSFGGAKGVARERARPWEMI